MINWARARKRLLSVCCCCITLGTAHGMDMEKTVPQIQGTIVQVVTPRGLGSGFWIDKRGYVATCLHVVSQLKESERLQVQSAVDSLFDLPNRNVADANWESFSAQVVATDAQNDLAILQVANSPFGRPANRPVIRFNGVPLSAHYDVSKLQNTLPARGGDIVLAGYPLGVPFLVAQPATVASVAMIGGGVRIVTSTLSNPGNSGGPLFNANREVIGVLQGSLNSPAGPSGLAIGIPAFFVTQLLVQLEERTK